MSARSRGRSFDPDDEQLARAYVLRLIKLRERSERELRDKLLLKGFSPKAEEAAVAHAKRSGLVDDALFARLWVAGRIRRPFGARRLRWELRRKGIAPSLIEEALSVAAGGRTEEEAVRDLVRARLTRMEGVPVLKAKERLARMLMRRGFPQETIFEVLNQELPDHETAHDT